MRTAAEAVLRGNDAGAYTLPSRRTYPHQWGWDSAFCALGWAAIDPDRAYRELESLVAARLPWGALPQIAFNPAAAAGYEPGPEWWGDVRARDGRRATGITQPPVAATCLRLLAERVPAPAPRLAALVRGLHAAHRALLAARGPVPVLVHPWESGRDNAVEWDAPLAAVPVTVAGFVRRDTDAVHPAERPSEAFYAASLSLVEHGRRTGWDQQALAAEGPFRVVDPGFLAVLARAMADLAAVADGCGEGDIAREARADGAALGAALVAGMEDGVLWPRDLRAGASSRHVGTALALTLLLPDLPAASLARLRAVVLEGELATPFGVRSLSPLDPGFDPYRYWRGPCWANVAWLCALGLRAHGDADGADELLDRLDRAVRTAGMREYVTDLGQGLGAEDFSWTAALWLWEQDERR